MKKRVIFLILISLIGLNQYVLAEPEENDFGIVNAWYNGQEATVRDVKLKIGEPAEIKVEVLSKIDGHVDVKLINPLKTESYEVVSGPSLIDERIGNLNIKSGWNETYIWVIKPTGEWTNGNAPINLFVQFTKAYDEYEHVEFTIANPIILDEQYSGPSPTPSSTTSSSANQSPTNGSPGFSILAALLGTTLLVIWKQRKI